MATAAAVSHGACAAAAGGVNPTPPRHPPLLLLLWEMRLRASAAVHADVVVACAGAA